MSAPAAPPPQRRLRKRLWQCGLALMLFLVTLFAASHFAGPDKDLVGSPGADFLPSYTAGSFVREGRVDRLMDLDAETAAQQRTRQEANWDPGRHTGPWLNPPFFAWVFVPFSALPYRTALLVWFLFNLLLSAAAIALLCGMLPRPRGTGFQPVQIWGLVPLLVVCSFPFVQALAHQQNTFLSLLLLGGTVALWRAGRGAAAGLVAGLLFFKPQLGAAVAVMLCASLGWRAALGVATSGAALLLVTLTTMPGALPDYLGKLPHALPWLEAGRPYLWERQVTFQGFWRLLLQFHATGPAPLAVRLLWPACALGVAACLAAALVRARRQRAAPATLDRLIAATVTAMPLLMPYYMDYDLLLLAVPAVLFAGEVCRTEGHLDRAGRWVLRGWVVLYPWVFLSAAVAGETRVHLTVPILAALALLQAHRVGRAMQRENDLLTPRETGERHCPPFPPGRPTLAGSPA